MAAAGLQDIQLADHVLRPWWKGQPEMLPPRLRSLVKALVRKPFQANATVRKHKEMTNYSKKWVKWGGLEIMTMVGQKPKDKEHGT